MNLTGNGWLRAAMRVGLCVAMVCALGLPGRMAPAQAVSTTTVQGTVYLANGQPGAGTLVVSWPSFTTAAGQKVAADKITVTIPADGFVSVKLAPNQGATPAGEFYTAVFYMSDGTTNTEYWVIPAAAQASLAQVEAQVMPAAQAVKSVSKTYVDQAITEALGNQIAVTGGNLTGPLYLNGDPTQPLQAADKHYVDQSVAQAVPLAGGSMTGGLTTPAVNGVQAPAAGSSQTTLQAAVDAAGTNGAVEIPPTYAGTDTFTNLNGVRVTDLRTSGAQQTARSVKEFGAVCDGVTDDTTALQEAIDYAHKHNVALTIPEGICKTRPLIWDGESIGGVSEQDSALRGFPGQDVLATMPDSSALMANTRIHDLTIYVDQSVDTSCTPAEGRAAGGNCEYGRPMESNSIFSQGGNGRTDTTGTGAGWWVGNCAIAMPATTGTGGNGLRNATIENVRIVATGTDPMTAQYPGARSTHTCGIYLAEWPQGSEFRNIDIEGLNTGIAMPALPVATPAGLTADSNRWQNITIKAAHAFTAAAGSNNVLDNVAAMAGNSAATAEPPTGIVLDLPSGDQGWTVRNAVVEPTWDAVQPQLTVTTSGGAVTGVTVGSEHGLGFDPYGTQVPLAFSTGCTAEATASVNSDGSIGTVTVTQGGTGCSSTTTASVNEPGTWDTAAPVNLIGGQDMTVFGGNLLKGNGGYTVWDASGSQSYGTQLAGGGGNLPGGGNYSGLVASTAAGSSYKVDQFPGADFGAKLQACLSAINPTYGGTCDARNFTGTLSMGSNLTISTANTTIDLPCATIATANKVIVTAGTRNVALHGCALRGGSAANGNQGGTVFEYSGTGAMVQVGDATYAVNTPGFHMDNAVISTTGATSATAEGLVAYRTQEMDLESLYFLGNANQTGMTLDGTGNYTGGTFFDDTFDGFGTAVNAVGHKISNAATTDWLNASTFVRLHIDCPTSNGDPIAGTIGINLQQGDGNTFTGGDVEGCATALHLGPNAQNNTIIGLRNENSTKQVVADAGSSYNDWITGGTMFTGQLTDNGTRNSFLDTFHRSFNGLNGDWYGSQQDATVTNHFRLGIGAGHERGLLNRYQTDYGYRWTTGLSDATAGEQFYEIEDELNDVYRLSIGQYNHGESSTNDQTVLNAAGSGAIVLNGSTNAGTGGVIFGSGGANASAVATINNAGNAQFNGTMQVGGTSTFSGTTTVKNQADAEIDSTLWAGLTAPQKESFIYKDWNGDSQWYMVKDTSNNWALNSAVGGLDSFKAYQSNNSGDTYINASNATGHIRLNYETGAGAETDIYSGSSSKLDAAFLGPASIKFPGLAASSGTDCLQIDDSGYISNTGSACGSGSGSTTGTINSGNTGQIAYYTANGTALGGMNTIPVSAGGTGAATASAALTNLLPGTAADGSNGIQVQGKVSASTVIAPSIQTCASGSTAASCVSGTTQNVAILPANASGSFAQYPFQPATAYCTVDQTTGALSIFPQQLGYGYTSAPTVTWATDTSYTGSLGTITAVLGGLNNEQVTSYTISGSNSGWGPAKDYYHGQCPIKITVAAPPTPANPVQVINQASGVQTYSQTIRPEDFGCKGDGTTDDTMCFNYAAQFAAAHHEALSLRSGATYYLGTVTGHYNGGFDTGEVPIAATLAITVSGGAMTGCTVTDAGKYLKSGYTYITNPGDGSGGTISVTLDTANNDVSACAASGGTGYSASFNAYSGPTCSGTPCTTLAPESVPHIGYSVALPSNLIIYGNGATIEGGFNGSYVNASSYSTSFPYVAAFGDNSTSGSGDIGYGVTIEDLNFKNTFIAIGNPGAQLVLNGIEFTGTAIPVQLINSQFDIFTNLYSVSTMAGIVGGGQWIARAPFTASYLSGIPTNNEIDDLYINGWDYHQMVFSSLAQWTTARKALDCWFDSNFFHLEDQGLTNPDACYTPPGGITRMTDQDQAKLFEPDAMWRGIMGIPVALYTRYGYATNNVVLKNITDKLGANYSVVTGPDRYLTIENLNEESNLCNGGGTGAAGFGSASCPNPYEPYNSKLGGMVLVPSGDSSDVFKTLYSSVVHPMADIAANTEQPYKLPIITSQNNVSVSPKTTNPVSQEGIRGFGYHANQAYQGGTTEIPSDGAKFFSTGTRYTTMGGTSFKPSIWRWGPDEAYVPSTMPPVFHLNHYVNQGNDVAEVLLPGLKVNGGLGVQGGQVTGFTVTNAGSGYKPYSFVACSVTASALDIPGTSTPYQSDCGAWAGQNGTIQNVWCTRCGQGYTSAPAVTISAPASGTTATATATIAGIDTDNPITHLTTCAFYLSAGGSIPASTTATLSGITCDGAQYSTNSAGLDAATVTNWPQAGGFPSGLGVVAYVTAANTISVRLTNMTSSSISYPAGTSIFPWVVTLQNSADGTWGINNPQVTPTVTETAYAPAGASGGSGSVPDVPAWLLWLGDGSNGAFNCTSGKCSMRGDNWYSSVNIAAGATAYLHDFNQSYFGQPLTIHSTGTCTIAGTLSASVNTGADGNNGKSFGSGAGGGGGGGTASGSTGSTAGNPSQGGTGGAASGGTGNNAAGIDMHDLRMLITGAPFHTTNYNLPYGGAKGGNGGSSGAAGGYGGGGIVLDCQAIDFTGTIDVSGAPGGNATANNTGAGGGGGGGFVIIRSQNLTNSGTINVSGGAGGSCGSYTGCGAGGKGADGWSEVFTH